MASSISGFAVSGETVSSIKKTARSTLTMDSPLLFKLIAGLLYQIFPGNPVFPANLSKKFPPNLPGFPAVFCQSQQKASKMIENAGLFSVFCGKSPLSMIIFYEKSNFFT
ncbi:hypothetical protein JQM66_00130 [Oscillibacter valericigenes]|nr:hypothetical protein [Oscillibacter valericigenes]